MPISTVADTITRFQRFCPGCTATHAQELFEDVLTDLLTELPVVITSASLRLTAGTMEYSLSSAAPWYTLGTSTPKDVRALTRIESATYWVDSDTSRSLLVTNTDRLTMDYPNWRNRLSATPTEIYAWQDVNGEVSIGVFPAPETATSPATGAGYPRVDLVYRMNDGATRTVLPPSVRDSRVFVYGMAKLYFEETNDDRWAHFAQLFLEYKTQVAKDMYNRQTQDRQSIAPFSGNNIGVV